MALGPKRDLLGIAVTQLFILNIAWAFYIVVRMKRTVALPDATAMWVYHNPTETTVVVTIVATVVSSMTLRYTLFDHPRGYYSVFVYIAVLQERLSMP